jgi:YfiH family protein
MIARSILLSGYPGLTHGFSTRHYGPVRTGARPLPEIVANRERLAAAAGFRLNDGVMLNQVHGNRVLKVAATDRGIGMTAGGNMPPDGDALITNDVGTVLIIRTADCVPVMFYDPNRRAAGVAHAGWKGTSLNIAGATLDALKREYGVDPRSVRVAMGPSIRACHYDVSSVDDDRVALFEGLFSQRVVIRTHDRVSLDLAEANRQQCLAAGILHAHVEIHPDCTVEHVETWASFRGGDRNLDHQIWSYVLLQGDERG